jgi:hypothetical protein
MTKPARIASRLFSALRNRSNPFRTLKAARRAGLRLPAAWTMSISAVAARHGRSATTAR